MVRVLIVDDNADFAELLETKLATLNLQVSSCHNSKTAIEAAQTFKPDLIILDVMLGDGLGYEVARGIRRDQLLYNVPVLFHSVSAEEKDVRYALVQGGDAFLRKPYTATQLLANLKQMHQLSQSISQTCAVTGMHGLPALRREIDHRIFRNEEFAAHYVFMRGIGAFRAEHGVDMEKKLASITANAIRETIKDYKIYNTACSHLGGGYFMVVTDFDDHKRFRDDLRIVFRQKQSDIKAAGLVEPRRAPGNEENKNTEDGPFPLLITTTHTGRAKFTHSGDVLQVLRKAEEIGKKADESGFRRIAKTSGHNHWDTNTFESHRG